MGSAWSGVLPGEFKGRTGRGRVDAFQRGVEEPARGHQLRPDQQTLGCCLSWERSQPLSPCPCPVRSRMSAAAGAPSRDLQLTKLKMLTSDPFEKTFHDLCFEELKAGEGRVGPGGLTGGGKVQGVDGEFSEVGAGFVAAAGDK